jgi:Na+/H+-dicarboxylate symporter
MTDNQGSNSPKNTRSKSVAKRRGRVQDLFSQAIRIILICLLVGLFLSWLDIQALTTLKALSEFLHKIVDLVVKAVQWGLPYVLMGAIVVVPIVVIRFVLRYLKR